TLALALNTSGKQNVTVVYDVMTIRNPYDGSSNNRFNEVTLQYRIGTAGSFTTIPNDDILYQNNTVTQTGTGVTTPQNSIQMVITLPAECEDQEIVQIRWISRQVSGAGSRPSFAIDNVQVTGEDLSSDPGIYITQNLAEFATFAGTPSDVQTYHLSGVELNQPIDIATSAPFQIRTPGGTWGTTLNLAQNYNGLIEVRYNPVSAGQHTVQISHLSYYGTFTPVSESFNVTGTATDATPVINVNANLSIFVTTEGNPSAVQSYTLTGLNLTGNITVTAPPHFGVSSDNSSFSSSINVAPSYNGLIYVRLTGASVGSFSGNIDNASPGATTVNIPVTGTVNPPVAPGIFLEENFEYLDGSALTANGWTAHSGAGTNSPTITSPGLTYPGYPMIAGLAAQTYNTGEDVHRTFSPITEGAAYVSFLINLDSATTTGDYIFHLGPDPIGTTFRGRVFVQKNTEEQIRFGISKAGAVGTAVWTDYIYTTGVTYLVLLKYNILPDVSNDVINMWINPNFAGTEPAPQLTATDLNTDIDVA
ncbi:MAG: hypothetical protein U1C33_01415, partial [Candidatus Cloacimonadaceae bacterium]|nr:hypothetical protein [Candidatus Cloacimonadaceae bacterium]